ncbi:capsule biosynthesis protein [Thiorhodovibrio frisius]|uniref:Capsule polysaccharide export protein n=1 Tax=Thiorhodovibrio frisius TaxID=631362 RepID=H8Z1U3_9GAMM|nr:capsular biosynthesis protein [Thiorhodovibrio frisius]EIC22571.1 capsule polysaccharide export protein [Thiorhodovibrio frisius]WPL20012.1 Capsule polysaccharide biosynthesis protein [Thiorhodovibrio frisius]
MLSAFAGQRVLLLQGPMGPFFWRLRLDLEAAGAEVFKINFCPGDRLYYPNDAIDYRGTLEDWPNYLSRLLARLDVDAVFLFGDCRHYHLGVPDVIRWQRAVLYVFEEGYLRPDFITVEKGGVNNFSSLSRDPAFYRGHVPRAPVEPPPRKVKNGFSRAAFHAVVYALANAAMGWRFPHYVHHRSLSPIPQAFYWLRAGWRKHYFGWRERPLAKRLTGALSKRYFIAPLQTHNDAQISIHSDFSSIEEFIEQVLVSFSRGAAPDHFLVFKHHPLDRGYREYGRFIARRAAKYGLQGRVLYVHDVHLPDLLNHTLGCVVINSTVGLSSILHKAPLCVLGTPIYDMPGLTFQGKLDDFWGDPGTVDYDLYIRFRSWLRAHNQANGNFYRPLPDVNNHTGVIWPPELEFDWGLDSIPKHALPRVVAGSASRAVPSGTGAARVTPVARGNLASLEVGSEL